jgi:Arc/MetJ-type ribon-helix-helix transcriptional regulator
MKTIQTEVPEQLYKEAQVLVKEGWFRDEKDIFSEAIRRFLDTPIALNKIDTVLLR